MAYQPYMFGGYQPAPYYPGPVPDQLAQLRQNQMQPLMQGGQIPQQMQQPIQPQASAGEPVTGGSQNGIVWVSGKQEADNYFVVANSAVALWDANNPVIYLRKADSTGKPSTVVYDLVERTDNQAQQTAPQIDLSGYVTWEKLDEYITERLKRPSKAAKAKEDTDNG